MVQKIDLERTQFHLMAVTVAAELANVKEQGEAISLEAMNAKVLVARAGNMALGFKPLTDFMVELADSTISLVREIEKEALAVSHQAVQRLRTSNAVRQARRALSISERSGANTGGPLKAFVKVVENQDDLAVDALLEHAFHLTKLLDDIAEKMLGAGAVASSIRIEAAAVDVRFSQSFSSVSDNLQRCSEAVLSIVKLNQNVLKRALKI
jgi:hypothetical protein